MTYELHKIMPVQCEASGKGDKPCEFTQTFELEGGITSIPLCTVHANQLRKGKPVALLGWRRIVPNDDGTYDLEGA